MRYFILILFFISWDLQAQNSEAGDWQSPHKSKTLKAAPLSLIPFPQSVEWSNSNYKLPKKVTIASSKKDQQIAGKALISLQKILHQNQVLSSVGENTNNVNGAILLQVDAKQQKEGYELLISKNNILIKAGDAAGFYYAVQTLSQFLSQKTKSNEIFGCRISDRPAFALRGFMHDNGRNFLPIETLKSHIEKLSWYKYNTFHWHLTDNPAWRPESKIYPQLNDPKNRTQGRDPDSSYSFDEIRELIAFARERCITIIPELDMPGHSQYFEPTFGFKMESEQGMEVLEKLIDEFCGEISAEDCPIIHIGSDEVHIPNPKEFIDRMTARVKANGRKVMVWNPGLPPQPGTIEQDWRDDGAHSFTRVSNPFVDSYGGYLNLYDAFSLVQRYFFQQICNQPTGDSLALGGILCCWPDARVDDKSKITLHNPVWPGVVAYSEAVWCGRPDSNRDFMSTLPPINSGGNLFFREFEQRLTKHGRLFFPREHFPFAAFGNIEWKMTGPFHRQPKDSPDKAFYPERKESLADTAKATTITGGVIRFSEMKSMALSNAANETIYLTGYIFSNSKRTMYAITGFEAAARSNRRSAGMPQNGKWDANGGAIFINEKELSGPVWEKPGSHRYLQPTWGAPANEIPFADEEFFWSRPPASINLEKGWNKILVRIPRSYKDQAWMFAFVPVVKNEVGKWEQDKTTVIRAGKQHK